VVSKHSPSRRVLGDVAVTDYTADQAIGAIRRAMDDDPAAPHFIQTVKRKGYRFIGAVDTSGS
jgi:DNA-binding winged helix-turn-helix (wHTH) protein